MTASANLLFNNSTLRLPELYFSSSQKSDHRFLFRYRRLNIVSEW